MGLRFALAGQHFLAWSSCYHRERVCLLNCEKFYSKKLRLQLGLPDHLRCFRKVSQEIVYQSDMERMLISRKLIPAGSLRDNGSRDLGGHSWEDRHPGCRHRHRRYSDWSRKVSEAAEPQGQGYWSRAQGEQHPLRRQTRSVLPS